MIINKLISTYINNILNSDNKYVDYAINSYLYNFQYIIK